MARVGTSTTPRSGARPRLVLVGAGHAHVQVLHALAMHARPDLEVTLVVDSPVAVYSGMVPGLIEGRYGPRDLEIDAVQLARRAGARVILARAAGLDASNRRVLLAGRPPLEFELASLDIGSSSAGAHLPGVTTHAVPTRPLPRLLEAIERFDALCAARAGDLEVVVVGGGAAGVELAATLESRARGRGMPIRVRLLAAGARLLGERPPKLATMAAGVLSRRGVVVECSSRVTEVYADRVVLADGGTRPADFVVWAAGAAPQRDFETAGVVLDADGFVEVEETLEVRGVPGLFAVGDCAAFAAFPWVSRAGVYAVRAGPLLIENLLARLSDQPLRQWRPQRRFLALLNLGDGEALGERNGLVFSGRWVMKWKDSIDRRFVERFRLPPMSRLDASAMVCGGCAAKLGPLALQEALGDPGSTPRPEQVLVGIEEADDVVAWRTPAAEVVVSNVELLRAFTSDHHLLGRVAAINALSDLDAKGVEPRAAQAIVALPLELGEAEAVRSLREILQGARGVLQERSVPLLGGHTARAADLLVGFAIEGIGAATARLAKHRPEVGDVVILTRALGSGVLLHADTAGRARGEWVEGLYRHLQIGNAAAAAVLRGAEIRSCTDVTGFGLVGHLLTLLPADFPVTVRIELQLLPALDGALELLGLGERSSFHYQNRALIEAKAPLAPADETPRVALLADPQTAGGLLVVAPAAGATDLLAQLQQLPGGATKIGEVIEWVGGPVDLV